MAGAPVDADGLPQVCESLDGEMSDECWFVRAEYSLDPADCQRAGEFGRQCALHVLVNPALGVAVGEAGGVEARAVEAIPRFKLSVDDTQVWEWIAAHGSRQSGALDRGWCHGFSAERESICLNAVDYIFERDLRKLASRKMVGCDGDLPSALTIVPNPAFEAIVTEVREEGLCVENPRPSHGEGLGHSSPFH